MDQKTRIDDAADQLLRYGSGVADVRLLDVLDLLTEINDDMANGRHKDVVAESCEQAAEILNLIARTYEA